MSELFTGSLKAPIAAGKPLDPYIEKLESDMTVTYFMLPVGQTSRIKTRRDLKRQIQKVVNHPRRFRREMRKVTVKAKRGTQFLRPGKATMRKHPKANPYALVSIWELASRDRSAPDSMFARCRDVTKRIPRLNTSDPSDQQPRFHHVVASISSRLWQANMSTKMTV